MLSTVRDILPGSRTSHCFYSTVKNAKCVPIVGSKKKGSATYKNVQLCSSVWACPLCAARIAERRRTEVFRAMGSYKANTAGQVLLITRTFPHTATDRLDSLMTRLKLAEKAYKSGNPYIRIASRYGIVGSVRNIELTFGENGWHPHIHELVFLAAGVDIAALKADLLTRWTSACLRAGLDAPSEAHGLDVRSGENASSYVTKMGRDEAPAPRQWTGADEVTKSHIKKGKGVSFSPFDLLRVANQSDDSAIVQFARARFVEFATALKGKRQLVVSPGLGEYFEDIKTDEEAAALPEDDDEEIIATLTREGWHYVRTAKQRAEVLIVARTQDRQAVIDYVMTFAPGIREEDLFFPEIHHARYRQKRTFDTDAQNAFKRGEEEPGTALPAAITQPSQEQK